MRRRIGVQAVVVVVAIDCGQAVVAAGRKDADDLEIEVQVLPRRKAAEAEFPAHRVLAEGLLAVADHLVQVQQVVPAEDDAVALRLQPLDAAAELGVLGRREPLQARHHREDLLGSQAMQKIIDRSDGFLGSSVPP